MGTIDDTITSIKASLYERVSNPLISSFFISWITWNYKFILVLFSSLALKEKFIYIEGTLYPFGWEHDFWQTNVQTSIWLIFGPLVTALAYLYLIYPKVGKQVFEDHKTHISEYENIKVDIEGKTTMSNEDVTNLRSQLRAIKNIYIRQLDEKDIQIDRIKLENKTYTKEAANAKNQVKDLENKVMAVEKLIAEKQEIESQLLKLREKYNISRAAEKADDIEKLTFNKKIAALQKEVDYATSLLKDTENKNLHNKSIY